MIPAIEYSAFVGAFGLLDALVGVAVCFLDMIPYIVGVGFDALADVFYLAGGVVSYLNVSRGCGSFDELTALQRIAVLLANRDFEFLCKQNDFSSYCTRIKADSAFEFLGFLITLALIGMGFMWQRGRGKLHSAV